MVFFERLRKTASKDLKNEANVIVFTVTGGNPSLLLVDLVIAASLKIRGVAVKVVACDGRRGACQECDIRLVQPHSLVGGGFRRFLCVPCSSSLKMFAQLFGLGLIEFSMADVPERELTAAEKFVVDDHAKAGALRYYAIGSLDGTAEEEAVLASFRNASREAFLIAEHLIDTHKPSKIICHHGIYVPQGLIVEAAKTKGIKVVCWWLSYRRHTLLFSDGDTYHRQMVNDVHWEEAARTELNDEMEKKIKAYLQARIVGAADWINFTNGKEYETEKVRQELPDEYHALFTNVEWDAQIHFDTGIFDKQLDWICRTIDFYLMNPHTNLVIRIHPAEVKGQIPSRQPILNQIQERYNVLPSNIRIVGPDEQLSSYAILEHSNLVLIYGSKIGIEAAARGHIVVVAGDAWCRNKGFTIDPTTSEEYLQTLTQYSATNIKYQETHSARKKRALRYAYYFFFQRMIEVKFLRHSNILTPYVLNLENHCDLNPGRDHGLDLICNGLIHDIAIIDE